MFVPSASASSNKTAAQALGTGHYAVLEHRLQEARKLPDASINLPSDPLRTLDHLKASFVRLCNQQIVVIVR